MKVNLKYRFAKLVIVPALIAGFSMSSFAAESNQSQLAKTLATSEQKSQFEFVAQKLKEANLPKELALIPVIESGYKNNAVSRVGAGGMWQLMPATAKDYGISSSQRFQTAPATVAALKYFNTLHKKFGNWQFAVAAYNAGDGRVQKALKQNPTATSVQQLNLPRETKQYVQKFNQLQGELSSYSA